MATQSTLLTVSVIVEQNEESLQLGTWRTDSEVWRAITDAVAALYANRPDIVVEWGSMSSTPLDGKPAVGRCAVCNRWVYDVENATKWTPTQISGGAVVDGRYRCDEHLPSGHPECFAGRGYDGPIPEAKSE